MLKYIKGGIMTYTFIGEKDFVSKELEKISSSFLEGNIVHYDLEEVSINRVIEDLNTISLFGDKFIIAYNIDVIDDTSLLEKYLDNESSNTLVLISYKELDKRKKIYKILTSKTSFKEFLNYDLEKVIKDNIFDYKMNSMAINMLISYCNNNLGRIENELEKLKLYKFDSKEITSSDVNNLVKKSYDATIFNLIDNMNSKNLSLVFKIYNELMEEGETEEKILYTIANHYRLLYQVSVKLKSLSDDEVIKEYKLHPYRFSKLKEQLSLVSDDEILRILKSLSDIDISIKSGKGDIKNLMFLFFNTL